MRNSRGFAHLYLLLFVAVLLVAGLVGWRVYQRQHKTVAANTSVQASTATTTTSQLDQTSQSLSSEPVDNNLNSNDLNSDIESLL